ncbi:MAG: thioredoxin-dependent peroxiredoxin [Patescibacteria group bacterium]|nr:thioredoxin-dependent peroxiredoxin [Patescibacteria group bacterium]
MKAPNFSLQDQDGQTHSLQDYLGQWVVIYFYPKDDTPGCTTEACSFRDEYDYIKEHGAVVFGISKDSVASHKKFATKYNLSFPLLSDESLDTIKAYGAWGERSMYGKKYMGIIRSTFLIDPKGEIVKEYPKVTPKDHAVQIVKDLIALQ